MSESDAVDALRLPFYSLRDARESHMQGNHYDLGNPSPDGSVAMVSSADHLAIIVLGGHGEHSS